MSAVLAPTAEERTEDWALFHLARARQSRMRLQSLTRSTVEYGAENHQRQLALQEAGKHVAILRGVGYPLSFELRESMRAEGVQ